MDYDPRKNFSAEVIVDDEGSFYRSNTNGKIGECFTQYWIDDKKCEKMPSRRYELSAGYGNRSSVSCHCRSNGQYGQTTIRFTDTIINIE